ncbi:exodeoxyribonuclease VII small subunit [Ornithinimicrobium avium]|uniref:Exodeoxyribonuclease 7 small subunit n=1 Tax=Ornithinimicrobium avium TaxID=2283195 RepID=A0A345NRE7_9MICO|nr:exodeoxyribonuclease VII small subunit [Ornithinimicrobium avium]AXH97605.1 exodeoxyribonuclease VII small subunit [Ornithinimicrobium avium]
MTQTSQDPAPVGELTYEQARDELVALVARIESGAVPLEESMLLWERGEQLAAHCQAKLDLAQETLDRSAGGGPAAATDGATTDGADEDDTEEDQDS